MPLLLMLTAMFAFSSCSDDDGDPGSDLPKDLGATVYYEIERLGDQLLVADVTVTYVDGNGNEQTEAVTSVPWKKEVDVEELPFDAHMEIRYAKKEGITFDKEEYVLNGACRITIIPNDQSVSNIATKLNEFSNKFAAENMDVYFNLVDRAPDVVSVSAKLNK